MVTDMNLILLKNAVDEVLAVAMRSKCVILRPNCNCVPQYKTMAAVTLANILWENVVYLVKIVLMIMSHRPQKLLYFGHNCWGYRLQFKTMVAIAIAVTLLYIYLKILFITISDRNLKPFLNHLLYETLTIFQWKIVLLDKDTFLNFNVNAGS
jgi:hypothetical protein